MKYKVGDKIRIKSLDWYNENKTIHGDIWFDNAVFVGGQSLYCGCELTIRLVTNDSYYVIENDYYWTDEMIECKVEETDIKPKFKVGDIIISDVFTTKNDKGWKVIDVERTGYRLISVNNSDLVCDMDFKNEHYYKLVDYVQADNIPDVIQTKTSSVCSYNGFYGYSDSEGNEISEWYLPEGYQFVNENGNIINAQKIVLEKKEKEYPKTYEECCYVLGFENTGLVFEDDYRDINPPKEQWKRLGLMNQLNKLLICRDAYWKIAGEEMELGKPWKPDWNDGEWKWCISYSGNYIEFDQYKSKHHTLAFPTEEMRDAFYENFKELIEECKELL